MGKSVSMTRCPVIMGIVGDIFSLYGLPRRTGQRVSMLTSLSPLLVAIFATVCVILNMPRSMEVTVPSAPCGTMILCETMGVSCTYPKKSPAHTLSPTLTSGINSHSFS